MLMRLRGLVNPIEAITAIILVVMGYYDIKQREVDARLVAASYAIITILWILYTTTHHLLPHRNTILPFKFYIIVDALFIGIASLLAFFELFGWGDVAVLGLVVLASPTTTSNSFVMPSIILVLLYFSIMIILFVLLNIARNLMLHRELLMKIPKRYRLTYTVIAKPVKVSDLLRRPSWWYPLNLCGKYHTRFNIYHNPEDIVKEIKKALSRGCLKKSDIVWVTYGHPGIAQIALAYFLSIILGDKPFIYLFT